MLTNAAAVLSLTRLPLLIQRLMDADLLLEEEAEALLAQVEAARQAPDKAAEGAQADLPLPLIERLGPLIESLLACADLPVAALPHRSAAGETSGTPIDARLDCTDRPGTERAAA